MTKTWTHGMIEKLPRITHCQWLLCNAIIHYRLSEGRTYVDRKKLVEKLLDLMWIDLKKLLPEGRLLLDNVFDKLDTVGATDQAYRVAKVEATRKAVQHEHDIPH